MKNTLLFILTLWVVTGHSQSIFELPKQPNAAFMKNYGDEVHRNLGFGPDAGKSLPPHNKTINGANNYVLDQGPNSDAVKKGLMFVEDTGREYPNTFYGKNAPMKTTAESNTLSASPANRKTAIKTL